MLRSVLPASRIYVIPWAVTACPDPTLFAERAGIKGKVLDSLAAGVPCVCTAIAMEGLALGPALQSLVAGDPAGFAASIARLHSDPALHEACRQEGLDDVARNLAPSRIDPLMQAAIASEVR